MISQLVRAQHSLLGFLLLRSWHDRLLQNKVFNLLALVRVFSKSVLRFEMEFAVEIFCKAIAAVYHVLRTGTIYLREDG